MPRSAEGDRLAATILALDRDSVSRKRYEPVKPAGPAEHVDAATVGGMLVSARQAGAADAHRANLEASVTEAQAAHLLDEYQTVLSGAREPLQAVQRLFGAGNPAGAHQLLAALQESPVHSFEAMAISGAIAQYESDAALNTAFAHQAADAEKAAHERARIQEARPDLGTLPAALEDAALSAGEAVTPKQAAVRAQVLRVAESNAALKASIAGSMTSIHREPKYAPDLEREVQRIVEGDPNIDRELGNPAPRSKVVQPGREADLTRLRVLVAGDGEANSAELHRARKEVEARQSDAAAKSVENRRGVGR